MAAISTIALVTAATAAVAGAGIAYQAGEEQKKANEKAEDRAEAAQAEQEALALQEKKAADLNLKESQQRLMKGTSGRSGLLFGSEPGVDDTKQTTLGA